MEDLANAMSWLDEHDFVFIGDTPMCSHCHHYNLFIDQTITDALGIGDATVLRSEAAREFFYQMLTAAFDRLGISSTHERLDAAQEIFARLGHGRVDLSGLSADGGTARGDHLHYAYTWLEKFGDTQARYHPADAIGAGYVAAAQAAAFGLPTAQVTVRETHCLVLGHDHCEFDVTVDPTATSDALATVSYDTILPVLSDPIDGIQEDTVEKLTVGLRDFLSSVAGDERGLIQAFGIFVTTSPSSIYNRMSYDLLDVLTRKHPSFVEVSASLLREAGRMCGFNTFGGILGSPEWEALSGTTERDMLTVAVHACTIARGLGFGRWSVADYEPGKMLTIQAPCTYEGPYFQLRHGQTHRPMCYLFEGACEAVAQLGDAVDWSEQPQFTPAFYEDVFAPTSNPWRAEQTRCVCQGDDFCEVTVTRHR